MSQGFLSQYSDLYSIHVYSIIGCIDMSQTKVLFYLMCESSVFLWSSVFVSQVSFMPTHTKGQTAPWGSHDP
jgi:hypothetical protein